MRQFIPSRFMAHNSLKPLHFNSMPIYLANFVSNVSLPGYSDHQAPPPLFGPPRTMLPPSPQHYPLPRFSQPPVAANNPPMTTQNGPPHPHKRPGSSMSISSMLGAEPERTAQEPFPNHGQPARPPSGQYSHQGLSMSLGAVMSPPQYSSKPATTEYSYKPRSKTPDRSAGQSLGVRPQRSSSGTMTQRPGPFYDPPPPRSQPNLNTFPEPKYNLHYGPPIGPREEVEDRARRTSIGGILQRPESQPPPTHMSPSFAPTSHPLSRPESIPPSLAAIDRPLHRPMHSQDPPRSNGVSGHYDTRPPGFATLSRIPQAAPPPPMSAALERPPTQSLSPELRRPLLNGSEGRLAGILNQQGDAIFGSQNMARQDSVQSQRSDRSLVGERFRANRAYSPFAGSVASGPLDDPARRGSEELTQHRAILSLANESKRGRYSPVPQAVQGAQAQAPAPDAGIKTEHGRVFAGIGSGLGSASTGLTPTPQPLPASPFKRDEGGARLSEENLMKMSRSSSGISKRNRKALDEDIRAESEMGDGKKGSGRAKRSKYGHSYKLDLDDAPLGQRKTLPTSHPTQRTATPTSKPTPLLQNSQSLPLPTTSRTINSRTKKLIKISTVVSEARRNPRRHLGIHSYDPDVAQPDHTQPHAEKFDVSIRPKLLPSFTAPEQINCTYTVKVSSMWLRQRERHLIGREQYLWGSGIYTDDSDPVAAAMHSGFITSAHLNDGVSDKWIEGQNPKIEGLAAPEKPIPVPEGKDLQITLVVLPQLESYTDSVRFGIKSRSWPPSVEDKARSTPHDGVSFMILKTEFLDDGIMNRRVGRTGAERRKRLQKELADRKQAFEFRDRKIAEALAKEKDKKAKAVRPQRAMQNNIVRALAQVEDQRSLTSSKNNGISKPPSEKENHMPGSNLGENAVGALDVGQSPDTWIKQLNDNAVTA